MRIYKPTNEAGHDGRLQWGPAVAHAAGPGPDEFIFAYWSPADAALFGPAFEHYAPARLWSASALCPVENGVRARCRSLTTIEPVEDFRQLSPAQHLAVAMERVAGISPHREFVEWSEEWTLGTGRGWLADRGPIERLLRGRIPPAGQELEIWRASMCCMDGTLLLPHGEPLIAARFAARALRILAILGELRGERADLVEHGLAKDPDTGALTRADGGRPARTNEEAGDGE